MNRKILLSIILGWALSCPNESQCSACQPGTDRCAVCVGGYIEPETGKCHLAPQNLPGYVRHCKTYDFNADPVIGGARCVECLPGFGILNGKCTPCSVPGCGSCPHPDKCEACQNGQTLLATKIKSTCEDTTYGFPDCNIVKKTGPTNFVCLECNPGFVLSSEPAADPDAKFKNSCVAFQGANCLAADPNAQDRCQECRWLFTLTAKGTCIRENPMDDEDETDPKSVQKSKSDLTPEAKFPSEIKPRNSEGATDTLKPPAKKPGFQKPSGTQPKKPQNGYAGFENHSSHFGNDSEMEKIELKIMERARRVAEQKMLKLKWRIALTVTFVFLLGFGGWLLLRKDPHPELGSSSEVAVNLA